MRTIGADRSALAVVVERPRSKEHGDYATNVALQLGKKAGTNPRAFAEEQNRRQNQRGPRIQGWRNTATNQNLNRDYAAATRATEAAITALAVSRLQRLRAALAMDHAPARVTDQQWEQEVDHRTDQLGQSLVGQEAVGDE